MRVMLNVVVLWWVVGQNLRHRVTDWRRGAVVQVTGQASPPGHDDANSFCKSDPFSLQSATT